MTLQFFELLFDARPSVKDMMLMYLRGFAGYGGSPGGWRSIDGRFGFHVRGGALSPRLDVDLVYHVSGHGFVRHLPHSDHGALRWPIEPTVPLWARGGAAGSSGGAGDQDSEAIPLVESMTVWEQLLWLAAKQSLSEVPVTPRERASVDLGVTGSRLLQFKLRKKVDFLGADASGLPWAQWEKALDDWHEAARKKLRDIGESFEEDTTQEMNAKPRGGDVVEGAIDDDEDSPEVTPKVNDRWDADGDYVGRVEDDVLGESEDPGESGGALPERGYHEFADDV